MNADRTGVDWSEVARAMGRDMAQTFLRQTPPPFTPETVEAGLKRAAAAVLVVFNSMADGIGGPAKVDALAAAATEQMLATVGDLLAAQDAVKH